MNRIFFAMFLIAFVFASYRQVVWTPPPLEDLLTHEVERVFDDPIQQELHDIKQIVATLQSEPEKPEPAPMAALTTSIFDSSKQAVTLAISLVGAMALFLGLMKIAEVGGLLLIIAKLIRPIMVRLFPGVPPDHPAMGAMILNMSANALGLGNAATPLGIKAMQELDKLNTERGTATNAMALFLAINTSSVTLLPTGVIVLRDSLGSHDPAGILGTTLFATLCSTAVAISATKLYQRFWNDAPAPHAQLTTEETNTSDSYPVWVSILAIGCLIGCVPLALMYGATISPWIVPVLVMSLLGYGAARGVRVYEVFIEGAKEGFEVAVRIIPYLVGILVAVGMLRSSGAISVFVASMGSFTSSFGMPAEALPMALLRPLSGSGAYGVMTAIMAEHGPDSLVGYLVSTLQGSTETTFYVIAVYFGAIGVTKIRHSLAAALTADFAGIIAAVIACNLYMNHFMS